VYSKAVALSKAMADALIPHSEDLTPAILSSSQLETETWRRVKPSMPLLKKSIARQCNFNKKENYRACWYKIWPDTAKRGNIYLRRMFIHGARAVLLRVKYDTAGLGHWVHQLEARAPRNKVIVAIANKLARIAWSVLFRGEDYRHAALAAA
jgi:hypothetical protein